MPRRLAEKTRHVRPRRFRKREKMYNTMLFQSNPVTKGQEIDATIDDIDSRNDGITRIQNFLIFVPQAKIGEHLNVKNTKVTKKFAIAGKTKQNEEEKNEN
jgi:predicted RNA-binding protein with TRAM domain